MYKLTSFLLVTVDSMGLANTCIVMPVRTAILLRRGWPFFALEGGITPTRSISQSGDQSNSSDMGHTAESALPRPLPHSGLLHLWEGEPPSC